MLKDYLKQHNLTLYAAAKGANVPYSTLFDLSCGKIDVRKCQVGILKRIADFLKLSLDEIYDISIDGQPVDLLKIHDKAYYIDTPDGEVRICRAKKENTELAKIFAEWHLEDAKEEKNFDDFFKNLSGGKL